MIAMGNKRGTFCAKLTLNILNRVVVFIDRKPKNGSDRKCLSPVRFLDVCGRGSFLQTQHLVQALPGR